MPLLCDVPIHDLAAGGTRLLQSSRNTAGHQAATFSHLNCQLRLKRGARHLLLGRNGCGKTTLLRCIASGTLEAWPEDVMVHLVGNDVALCGERTALDIVLAGDARVHALQLEVECSEAACAAPAADEAAVEAAALRLCDLYAELEGLGADDEERRRERARSILRGLGLGVDALETPVRTLSGGWRLRVALAAALFASPDLLLLDEPTNHLDLHAIDWLQRFLTHDFRGTLLCVSHDRAFIEEVATEVVSFEATALEYHSGTLLDFERTALQRSKMLERQVAALERQKDHVLSSAKAIEEAAAAREERQERHRECQRFAPMQGGGRSRGAKQCSQVTQRLRKLGRMGLEKTADGFRYRAQEQEGPRLGAANNNDGGWVGGKMTAAPLLQRGLPELRFGFPEPEPLGTWGEDVAVLQLREATFEYPGHDAPVLRGVDVSISAQTRLAVTGRNGAGKSTLVELLAGRLEPAEGERRAHPGLRIAYFSQHQAEELGAVADSALANLCACQLGLREHEALEQLEAFGLDEGEARRSLCSLSAGQRVRACLAQLCAQEPHLLILDEPSNHLDIYSIDALTDALKAFAGAVVLVTHNRRLIEEVARDVIVVEDGRAKRTTGQWMLDTS